MIRSSFRIDCFGDLVFISCKKGNFMRGVGHGSTIAEALHNMIFWRVIKVSEDGYQTYSDVRRVALLRRSAM